jgi:phosphopantetheine adenylyltransferase
MANTALLLLPPPPEPPTYAAVKASYNAPLLLALRSCSNAASGSILDIALPCPQIHEKKEKPRAAVYSSVQSLLANLYKLVTTVAARDHINVEDTSGVDVRILLISYPRDGNVQSSAATRVESPMEGPVVDIVTLGRCHQRWSKIFSVESEEGEQILKNFAAYGLARATVQKLRGGIVSVCNPQQAASGVTGTDQVHYHPAVGGTFDHLHIGHKLLLTMTIFMADPAPIEQERTVTVGITAEDLLKNKKYAEFLEDWHERYAASHAFVHALMSFDPKIDHPEQISEIKNPGPNGHAVTARYPSGLMINYVEIWDPFGPTITEEKVDSLVISAETRAGGKAVNDKRKEQGWRELDVYEVDVLDAEESDDMTNEKDGKSDDMQQAFQNKLSSTEIRKKQALSVKGRSKV